MTKSSCNDLEAFYAGTLAPDAAEAFRGHLATCSRCQSLLSLWMQVEATALSPLAAKGRGTHEAVNGYHRNEDENEDNE